MPTEKIEDLSSDDDNLDYRTEEFYSFEASEEEMHIPMKICPECNGTNTEECLTCDGEGQIPDEEAPELDTSFFEEDPE
jgi:DnaJ-class molecular chaperone